MDVNGEELVGITDMRWKCLSWRPDPLP